MKIGVSKIGIGRVQLFKCVSGIKLKHILIEMIGSKESYSQESGYGNRANENRARRSRTYIGRADLKWSIHGSHQKHCIAEPIY